MARKNSQHHEFVYDAMPGLFHSTPVDFITFLERDGMKFLNFWWDHLGQKKPTELLTSSKGMTYEMRTLEDGTAVILLTMPPPQNDKEAYFLALTYKPEEQKGMIKRKGTRCFTLEMWRDDQGTYTVVGEVTPRRVHHDLGEGPQPQLDAFFDAVCRVLNTKTTWRDLFSLK